MPGTGLAIWDGMNNATNAASTANTIVVDQASLDRALQCARGDYQRSLLLGEATMSGAGLRGAARGYAARYKESRKNLLGRMTAAGVPWCVRVVAHGRRVLVIGAAA